MNSIVTAARLTPIPDVKSIPPIIKIKLTAIAKIATGTICIDIVCKF